MAKLEELETTWSLDDMSRARSYLALKAEAERRILEAETRKAGNG